MDKLRAIEYFAAAAESGSFSAAARAFDVSVPAVAKLVRALEASLGVALFDRSTHGLALTTSGASYLRRVAHLHDLLERADDEARAGVAPLKGTLTVGMQHVIARECLTPALPGFHIRYPEIVLDIREIGRGTEEEMAGLDMMVLLGWHDPPTLVRRRITAGKFVVAAAPDYWAAHGMPRRPEELGSHVCLPIRAIDSTLMSTWTFVRGAERIGVDVGGWVNVANAHRDIAIELCVRGQGVVRILDWMNLRELGSGALVPALRDWESPEAPPVNILYRSSARRMPRVRAFVDFVTDVFRELEQQRGRHVEPSPRPAWLRRRGGGDHPRPARQRR